ncbi:HEAT repeat domain-containing protein [Streptomyces sp. NPDC002845]
MIEPGYRTHRYVLHPDKHWGDVADFAEELGWPLVHQRQRSQTEGVDGQMIWQSESGVSVHYIVDATSGIGYITLTGPDDEAVSPFLSQAKEALEPWQLEELYQKFDGETDLAERGRLTLRIGLAAPAEPTAGCVQRIRRSLSDEDARMRLAGLWAVSYTGYEEFVEAVQNMAQADPESWIRTRAESVVTAFSVAGDEE